MTSGESSWRGNRTSDPDSQHGSLSSSGDVNRGSASAVPKRTRQLQVDAGYGSQGAYLPPALREGAAGSVQEGAQPPDDVGTSLNARGRARAGTLPSSWGSADAKEAPSNGAGTRFASPLAHRMSSLRPSTGAASKGAGDAGASATHGIPRLSAGPLGANHGNAGGRLATLRNSAFEDAENSNRLRSGSMTNAMSALGSNPFGPSLFSSTWLQSNTSAPPSRRSPMPGEKPRGNTVSFLDEYQEGPLPPGARPSIAESLDGSENVQTLDYLGLADARNSISSVADHSADERRPSSHFVNARNRASTLATAPRNAGNSPGFVLRSTPEHGFDDVSPLAYGDEEVYAAFAREHGIDPAAFAAAAAAAGLPAGLPPQNQQSHAALVGGRLRAGTVAALGGPGGRHRVEQELLRLAAASQFLDTNNSTGHAGAQERREALSALGIGNYAHAPMEGFPHVSVSTPPADTPSFLTRPSQTLARKESGLQTPVTPGAEHRSSPQIPGRSLWIGQLSAGTTGQELMQMFAPYGAIESLRLLPEKECGFVNFVEAADAIRAKDDIMQRQGGRVGKGTGPNGAIRIGYGKIDSVPSAPPMSSGYSTPGLQARGLNSPRVETPGLGDPAPGTPGEIGPTRALWVGSIPANTTNNTLMSIFQPFGPIESVRVLSHKNCGFINFERVDDAVLARKMLNGRDVLGSETGSMRIGFAKVPTRAADDLPSDPSNAGFAAAVNALSGLNGAASAPISAEQQLASGGIENYRSNLVADLLAKQHRQSQAVQLAHGSSQGGSGLASVSSHGRGASLAGKSASSSIVPSSDKGGVPLPADMQPRPATSDLQLLMRELSADDPASVEADVASVANARSPASYYTTIPLVSEQSASRRFDTSRLRELRKHIESASCTVEQVDAVAADHMDAIVDLAHDYIGNTVVQKLFERCSDRIKHVMLERIAPHLAMIGIHKNGTWAAQKIIETSVNPAQVSIIAQNLRPYVPPLLLDQFGNYVVQCCLHWNAELSDFIFEAMTDRCWEIAQGRFGARSMRACLESSHVTNKQRKKVALSVILNSVPLATSPNGALLLTWLLDTSNLPGRYRLLAPRFAPYLVNLCTHKLASLTVLRIVCQKSEPEASEVILDALFTSPDEDVLQEVITDQVHGSQFITKVLAWISSDGDQYPKYSEQVRRIVVEHSLVGVPAYRKLVEDLGLTPGPAPGQIGGPGVVPRNDLSLPPHLGPFMSPSSPNGLVPTHVKPPIPLYPANSAPAPDLGAVLAQMQLQPGPPGGVPSGPLGAPIRMDGTGPPPLAMNTRPNFDSGNSYPAHLRSPQSDAFNPWSSGSQDWDRNDRSAPQQHWMRSDRQPPLTPPRMSQNSYMTSRR